MSLHPGGQPQQPVIVQLRFRATRQRAAGQRLARERPGRQQAGHDGAGRRAEAETLGDLVLAGNPEAAWLPADGGKRGPHSPDDQVLLAGCGGLAAVAGHLDLHPVRQDLRPHRVVQAQREPEGVEARAEVRAGRRDGDGHLAVGPAHPSSSAAAAAAASTPIVTGADSPAMAVSGSFSPLPVIVQTTTEPAGTCPRCRACSRPATPAAEAGSPKTPSRWASSR